MTIDIYESYDNLGDMEQSLIDNGLIATSGGRVSVRKTLGKLVSTINKREDIEGHYFGLTYNHPYAELGYVWDETMFSLNEAKSMVIYAYNKTLNSDDMGY